MARGPQRQPLPRSTLTPGEVRILRSLAQHNAVIAKVVEELKLTVRSVNNRSALIRQKLGTTTTKGAITKARTMGLIE